MTKKPASLDELKSRYESMIGFTPPEIAKRLELGLRVDPDLVTALEDWRIAALTPDALDQKTVQLMAFAILLVQTSEAAANHAKAAIKAGATLEELQPAPASPRYSAAWQPSTWPAKSSLGCFRSERKRREGRA